VQRRKCPTRCECDSDVTRHACRSAALDDERRPLEVLTVYPSDLDFRRAGTYSLEDEEPTVPDRSRLQSRRLA
jgi:hypothetical protein